MLENYRRSSRKRIAIDGVAKTRYEWTRQQRKLETAVRRQKDIATGDGVLRREAQYKIERYQAAYDRITDKAMLTADKSRMRMSGVRSVKALNPVDRNASSRYIKNVSGDLEKNKGIARRWNWRKRYLA